MTASPSVRNVIFGSQSVKKARTGPDGLLTTLDLLGRGIVVGWMSPRPGLGLGRADRRDRE